MASLSPAQQEHPVVDLVRRRLQLQSPVPAPTELIRSSFDGILAVSAEDIVLSWNPAMERITGVVAEDAIGRSWTEVLGPDAPSPASAGEVELARPDGTRRWIRFTSNLIDRGGDLPGIRAVVARDATADVEAERAGPDFVAAVSHELRAPLTPLKGYVEMIADGLIDLSKEEARIEVCDVLLRQVARLERLVGDLLEAAAIERGSPSILARPVEVLDVVREQVAEFRWQAPERDIQVVCASPGPRVVSDPMRVGQVVSNLLSNALKYSPTGSPIEVRVASDGNEALVAVTDEGDGIPPSEQPRVFERFHRLDNGSTAATGGAGLGLYIAKQLVEAMSGRLGVSSEPGRGSTFWFTLPLANAMPPVGPEVEVVAPSKVIVVGESIPST